MAVPFAVTMALGALGLSEEQKNEVINNTIPALDDAMKWYNTHPDTVKALFADVQKAAPGIGMVVSAMAGKNMNLSQALHAAGDAVDKQDD